MLLTGSYMLGIKSQPGKVAVWAWVLHVGWVGWETAPFLQEVACLVTTFPTWPLSKISCHSSPIEVSGLRLDSEMGELSSAARKPLCSVSGHLHSWDSCGCGFWLHRIAAECAAVPPT